MKKSLQILSDQAKNIADEKIEEYCNQNNVIFMLEGFEESAFAHASDLKEIAFFKNLEALKELKVIITARPSTAMNLENFFNNIEEYIISDGSYDYSNLRPISKKAMLC